MGNNGVKEQRELRTREIMEKSNVGGKQVLKPSEAVYM